jgi:hypothetical protein
MREQSAETQETLPWRLRIFEKFPNQPQMVSLKRVPNEFNIPKIRESFMRQFLEDECNLVEDDKITNENSSSINHNTLVDIQHDAHNDKAKQRASIRTKSSNSNSQVNNQNLNDHIFVLNLKKPVLQLKIWKVLAKTLYQILTTYLEARINCLSILMNSIIQICSEGAKSIHQMLMLLIFVS